MFLLLHIGSYLLHIFRVYDIKLNGQLDLNGVYSARKESFFSNVETFIICILIGFTVKHLYEMDRLQFHDEGIVSYFIVLDSVITFFYKPFTYIGLVIKIDGEIRKNLYTLFFLQSEIIKQEKKEELLKEIEEINMKFRLAIQSKV